MRLFPRRRHPRERIDPELPEVSQPMPPPEPPRPRRSPAPDVIVLELTELEARALCAREGIPVFWPRPGSGKHG